MLYKYRDVCTSIRSPMHYDQWAKTIKSAFQHVYTALNRNIMKLTNVSFRCAKAYFL